MAKYTITYKCGHTAEIQLFGKYTDRDRKIAYYRTIDCPECEAKNAAKYAQDKGYAELTGSSKQICWANKIRNQKIAEAEHLSDKITRNKDLFLKALKKIKNESSSTFWIDNRDTAISELLTYIMISTVRNKRPNSCTV